MWYKVWLSHLFLFLNQGFMQRKALNLIHSQEKPWTSDLPESWNYKCTPTNPDFNYPPFLQHCRVGPVGWVCLRQGFLELSTSGWPQTHRPTFLCFWVLGLQVCTMFRFILWFYVYEYFACMCTICMPRALRDQKRLSDSLGQKPPYRTWNLNPDPLQEKYILLTAPTLRPNISLLKLIKSLGSGNGCL